jgi:hypothetical protein
MTSYQQSIEATQSWKEAVSAMWKRQRMMLYMSIATLFLLIDAAAALIIGICTVENEPSYGIPMIILGVILFLLMLAPIVISVVMSWIFYFDIRRWRKAAPESLKRNIRLYSIGLLIVIITSTAVSCFGGFTTIPYIGGLAQLANSFIELIALGGVIVQFIAIIKLRNAKDMPEKAQKGAHYIFLGQIISFATSIIFSICFAFAVILALFHAVNVSERLHTYEDHINQWYDYDDKYSDRDDIFTAGISYSLDEEAAKDEDMALFEQMMEADSAVIVAIFSILILITGCAVSLFFNYRGWWLIGKSELKVPPIPIEEEESVEEVACEVVEFYEEVDTSNHTQE